MRGTMLIMPPNEAPTTVRFDRVPSLEELNAVIGDGPMVRIPEFQTIGYRGIVMDCVALCNDNGKLLGLPLNVTATAAWQQAMRRSCVEIEDVLCGPVIVLFGDREFMGTL